MLQHGPGNCVYGRGWPTDPDQQLPCLKIDSFTAVLGVEKVPFTPRAFVNLHSVLNLFPFSHTSSQRRWCLKNSQSGDRKDNRLQQGSFHSFLHKIVFGVTFMGRQFSGKIISANNENNKNWMQFCTYSMSSDRSSVVRLYRQALPFSMLPRWYLVFSICTAMLPISIVSGRSRARQNP